MPFALATVIVNGAIERIACAQRGRRLREGDIRHDDWFAFDRVTILLDRT